MFFTMRFWLFGACSYKGLTAEGCCSVLWWRYWWQMSHCHCKIAAATRSDRPQQPSPCHSWQPCLQAPAYSEASQPSLWCRKCNTLQKRNDIPASWLTCKLTIKHAQFAEDGSDKVFHLQPLWDSRMREWGYCPNILRKRKISLFSWEGKEDCVWEEGGGCSTSSTRIESSRTRKFRRTQQKQVAESPWKFPSS